MLKLIKAIGRVGRTIFHKWDLFGYGRVSAGGVFRDMVRSLDDGHVEVDALRLSASRYVS